MLQAEKRAHHNALERKRRDHIKDSFTSLRESVPALQNEKVVCSKIVSIHLWYLLNFFYSFKFPIFKWLNSAIHFFFLLQTMS